METTLLAETRRARTGLRAIVVIALALVVGALALPAAGEAAPAAPAASTGGVANVTFSSAILNGYIDARGAATNYVFQYGTTPIFGAQTPFAPAGNGTISIKVSQTVMGLAPATLYHYRVVAISPSGTCLLYTSPSPRDRQKSRMPSSA